MITIYGMTDSGNCYKPRLLLAKLGRPFRHVEVNSLDGSTRNPGRRSSSSRPGRARRASSRRRVSATRAA